MILKKRYLFVALVLLLSFSAFSDPGCYFYEGASDALYCAPFLSDDLAKKDCGANPLCDFTTVFTPNSDCSNVAACRQITCSDDCSIKPRGRCLAQGGKEVPENEFAQWCVPGCCVVGSSCSYPHSREECSDIASLQGTQHAFYNPSGMNTLTCKQHYCALDLEKGIIRGSVDSKTTIHIEELDLTQNVQGNYKISVPAGTYTLVATSLGRIPDSQTLSVEKGIAYTLNLKLDSIAGKTTISGIVKNEKGELLKGAKITWAGKVSGSTFTNEDGSFIVSVDPGKYVVSARSTSYGLTSQKVTASKETQTKVSFTLRKELEQGVKGVVYIDKNSNAKRDVGEEQGGVEIYVDSQLIGTSVWPSGTFEAGVPPSLQPSSHTISAQYQEFFFETKIVTSSGTILSQDIKLEKNKNDCSSSTLQVSGTPVRGKSSIRLQWKAPCIGVLGYKIERHNSTKIQYLPASSHAYIDEDVEWGSSYSYTIQALLKSQNITVSDPITIDVHVGNEECNNKYSSTKGWDSFCVGENSTTIFTCSNDNTLKPVKQCAIGKQAYCAPFGNGNAGCKENLCLVSNYGLFDNSASCYGSSSLKSQHIRTYCSYDVVGSIESCRDCSTVVSCKDYNSKGACQVNSCLTKKCEWKNVAQTKTPDIYKMFFPSYNPFSSKTSKEFNAGYCIEKDAKNDCSLCGPKSSLFENNFCTGDVCSALGNCFSEKSLQTCNTCPPNPTPKANCYTFVTKNECSANVCGWDSCTWIDEGKGKCVKDSNNDGKDDCANVADAFACRTDIKGPDLSYNGPTIPIITVNSNKITLTSDASATKVFYCLNNNIKKCSYKSVSGFKGSFVIPVTGKINGKPLLLTAYAVDPYQNKGEPFTLLMYVDTVAPSFTFKEEISTKGEATNIRVVLTGLKESTSCSFNLDQIFPAAKTQRKLTQFGDAKSAVFSNLRGVSYRLDVTCRDIASNIHKITKLIRAQFNGTVVLQYPSPNQILAAKKIAFKASTKVPSSCVLMRNDEQLTQFISDTAGTIHTTQEIPGFVDRVYSNEYVASCQQILSGNVSKEAFNFTIDFSPPQTMVTLIEDDTTIVHVTNDWQESFIQDVTINLTCVASGFSCDSVYYCLGDSCPILPLDSYTKYTSSIKSTTSNTICYYSTDTAKSNVFTPSCGKVIIEGFGLEISNAAWFSTPEGILLPSQVDVLEFSTKVPTATCLVGANEGFITTTAESLDSFGGYSLDLSEKTLPLYIRCYDLLGNVGPEQEINYATNISTPNIVEFIANPSTLPKGSVASLKIITDEYAHCKFSTSTSTYDLMPYSFSESGVLDTSHTSSYVANENANITLFAQCQNALGKSSQVKKASLRVASLKTVRGITSLKPQGTIPFSGSVPVVAHLSHAGACLLSYQGQNIPLTLVDPITLRYEANLKNVTKKDYSLTLSCTLGSDVYTESLSFSFDTTVPTITTLDDKDRTCGKQQHIINVATKDSDLHGYEYLLYEKDDETFSLNYEVKKALLNTSVDTNSPVSVPTHLLKSNQSYYIQIRAVDTAGNQGIWRDTDGFIISGDGFDSCKEKNVSLAGNVSGVCVINIPDDDRDGDGVADACDKCLQTAPNAKVDAQTGCGPKSVTQTQNSLGTTGKIPQAVEITSAQEEVSGSEIEKESTTANYIGFGLLLLGILSVLSGSGYLVHYYKRPAPNKAAPNVAAIPSVKIMIPTIKEPEKPRDIYGNTYVEVKRERQKHAQKSKRKQLFDAFGGKK